jgi:diguanylate cyclase (GGDEF)-like protein
LFITKNIGTMTCFCLFCIISSKLLGGFSALLARATSWHTSGGEEFAILAPGLADDSLVSVAERLHVAVAGELIEVGPDTSVRVTLSIGVASLPLHTSKPDELVMLADRALYGAKQAGRDRILIGGTEMPAR